LVERSKGIRSKTRKLLAKKPRTRGIHSITRALQHFDEGASVSIVIDPSVHKGMPHNRYQGYTGKVEGKQGSSYLIGIFDGKKHKTLIARPEHLRRVR
jgi:large subunit ribosomal protein L21e